MKFSEMPYERPDIEDVKDQLVKLTARLKAAEDYAAAKTVFLEKEKLAKHVETLATLAHIRHSIDTRDKFYDEEIKFWNGAMPQLEEYLQTWSCSRRMI